MRFCRSGPRSIDGAPGVEPAELRRAQPTRQRGRRHIALLFDGAAGRRSRIDAAAASGPGRLRRGSRRGPGSAASGLAANSGRAGPRIRWPTLVEIGRRTCPCRGICSLEMARQNNSISNSDATTSTPLALRRNAFRAISSTAAELVGRVGGENDDWRWRELTAAWCELYVERLSRNRNAAGADG